QMWQRVQASHLQVAPSSKTHRLGQAANPHGKQAASKRSSKAIARILTYARTAPYLGDGPQILSLQAPSLTQSTKAEAKLAKSTAPTALCRTQQVETGPVKVAIRAIASQIEHRQLVLVSRHNDILDCLTDQQQTEILRHIDAELVQLSVPQPLQLPPQPHSWQQSIEQLAFPARRLRQLPAATEKLVRSSVDAIYNLSRTAVQHPWMGVIQEAAISTIPTHAAKVIEAPARLALPPARQLLAEWVQPPLQELRSRMVAALPTHSVSEEGMPLPPLGTALAWRTLQQQFQVVWNREDSAESNGSSSALPTSNDLGALPFGRTHWVKNFLKLSRPNAAQPLPTSEVEGSPLLPPSPPLKLLQPATIGFLRPAARGSVVLRRSPAVPQKRASVTAIPIAMATPEVAVSGAKTKRIDTVEKATANSVTVNNQNQCNRPKPNNKLKPNNNQHRQHPSSTLRNTTRQRQAPTNTYIDVEATDLGYEQTPISKGVDWLDRGVFAIEEGALKAWQWWCDLVEPEGAPKPINLLGAPHEGREWLVASTHRSQAIATASAELSIALFQELWPITWHFLQTVATRGWKGSFKLLKWLLSVALPIAIHLFLTIANWGILQLSTLLQYLRKSL
ncbi:MAG: hypothetical protein AB4040_06610, partial [Synechococcus sp.]